MDSSDVLDNPHEQDWDADDFEIPNLKAEEKDSRNTDTSAVKKPVVCKDKSNSGPIYLGPHGAPPSQVKQRESNTVAGKKIKRKQKVKDSDKNGDTFGGRESKVDGSGDLLGNKGGFPSTHGTPSGWLDSHCHDTQFERLA